MLGWRPLADAGVASLADHARGVAGGVTSPADLAGDVTIGVASLADAGVASLADLAGEVMLVADPVGVMTDGVAFLERCGVRCDSVFVGADVGDNGPDCVVCDEPGDVDNCPDVTFLTEPVDVA